MAGKAPIGVELVRRGIVKEADIEAALSYQKEHPDKKLGDILNILNICPQSALIAAMGDILGEKVIIFVKEMIKVDMTKYYSIDIAKACKAIIFEVIGNKAKVCFSDTSNKRAIEQIRLILLNKGLIMDRYLTFESNILEVFKSIDLNVEEDINPTSADVTGLIDTILKIGMEKRASDIHIEPLEDKVRVRYRIDGELVEVSNISKKKQQMITGRLKSISNMHQEITTDQDGSIMFEIKNNKLRVETCAP